MKNWVRPGCGQRRRLLLSPGRHLRAGGPGELLQASPGSEPHLEPHSEEHAPAPEKSVSGRELPGEAQATGITQLCWAAFGLLPSVLGRLSPRPSSTLSTLTVGWRGPGDGRILPWPCFPTCEAVGSVHLSLHRLTLSADAQSPTWEARHLNIPACQTPRIPGPKPWSPKAPTARKSTSH